MDCFYPESLAMLAERISISAVVGVKGGKEDTVLAWLRGLRAAATHAEVIEEILLSEYCLTTGGVSRRS